MKQIGAAPMAQRAMFNCRLSIFLTCLTVLTANAQQISTKSKPPGAEYELLFEDNFDGKAPDEKKWHYRVGERLGLNINGFNTKESVSQKDGLLVIENKVEMIDGKPKNIGGGLISNGLFGYGYYEVRAKPYMGGRGLHSAFWQRGESDLSANYSNTIFEIDGFEIDSPRPHSTNNLYVRPNSLGRESAPWPHRGNRPIELDKDGWLFDAYDYSPHGITFFDNGVEVGFAEYSDDFPELIAQQNVWLTALNGVGRVDPNAAGATYFDYFRFYARDYPGHNILPNGTFEYNQTQVPLQMPVAWRESGDLASSVVRQVKDAKNGGNILRHGATKAFEVKTFQTLEHIRNGSYSLSGWVRSSADFAGGVIRLTSGNRERLLKLPSKEQWTKVDLNDFSVSNNQVTISLESSGKAGDWIEFDDLQFMKPGAENKPKSFSFDKDYDPIWRIFQKRKMTFKGDDDFYFFDRNVGIGESITVNIVVNAAALQNSMPILRTGKTGKDGWAVGIDAAQNAYCLIGSLGDHTQVVASGAYEAGKPVALTCVHDRGNLTLYVNGEKKITGYSSQHGTRDEKNAGRLGATSALYDAVGDVTGSVEGANHSSHRNFVGILSNVQIFNRALSEVEVRKIGGSLEGKLR